MIVCIYTGFTLHALGVFTTLRTVTTFSSHDTMLQISVAVRLDGNSSLGYNTPPEVAQSDFLCVSLFFRPEVFSGTLFSTPTLTGQPLSLFIVSGGVALSYPTSMSDKVVTRLPFPVENDWYHLLATEDSSSGSGSSVRLSVAEFGGGRQWSTTEVIPGKGLNYSSSTEVTIGGGPPFEGMVSVSLTRSVTSCRLEVCCTCMCTGLCSVRIYGLPQ